MAFRRMKSSSGNGGSGASLPPSKPPSLRCDWEFLHRPHYKSKHLCLVCRTAIMRLRRYQRFGALPRGELLYLMCRANSHLCCGLMTLSACCIEEDASWRRGGKPQLNACIFLALSLSCETHASPGGCFQSSRMFLYEAVWYLNLLLLRRK